MDKRIPYHLKGKGLERGFSPPPRKRIRAPEIDSTDLIAANSLVLMGRLTNPSAQRLWPLFTYLSNRWNLKGKATGADLGRGCFQFSFDLEEDLQKEPVISENFPSMIPFWIEPQGLPKHNWKPEMLTSIGEEIGEVVDMEITIASAKFKVLIDGLQPLIKDTIVEFSDGSEAIVTLDYKNLTNHCHYCHRLSHEEKNCLGIVKEPKKDRHGSSPDRRPMKREQTRNYYLQQDNFRAPTHSESYHPSHRHSQPRHGSNFTINASRERSKEFGSKKSSSLMSQDNLTSRKRKADDRDYRSSPLSHSRQLRHRSPPSRRSPARVNSANAASRQYKSGVNSNFQWRAKNTPRELTWTESSENSRTRRPPLEREAAAPTTPWIPVPIPTNDEVMGELREVTVQYTNVADPTESLARRQRVLQGEAKGLMAETAAQIIASAARLNESALVQTEDQTTMEPALSSDLPIHPAELPTTNNASLTKKKRGRPPLNKPGTRSPSTLAGAKSSKRNKTPIQNSPKRRATAGRTTPSNEEPDPTNKKKPAKQRISPPITDGGPSSSRAPPQGILIPASQTKLWREPWPSITNPLTSMGPPTKQSHNLCVSHLVSPTSLTWDKTKIQLLLPDYEKEIMEIRLSKLGATDAYAWLPSKTGLYTAKSGYYERIKHDEDSPPQQTESDTFKWSSDIWQLKTSPKMKFHLWKAMRGALLVGANLQARQINTEAKCPLCGDTETTHHLFLTCQFASQVWELAPVKTPLALNRISSFRDLVENAKFLQCLPPCGLGEGPLFPWILWTIWLARNKKIFNDRAVSPREAITQAIFLARDWFVAQVASP
ncbi:unnamed protein product [Arabidopsis halleri]